MEKQARVSVPVLRTRPRQPAPTTMKVFSGRLALRLEHRYRNRTWADRSRWRLEELLGDVLDHIDSLARAEIERQREAHEQGLRDLERWERAVEQARLDYIASLNRRRMRNQAARSARAAALRTYAERVRAAATAGPDGAPATEVERWYEAIVDEADRIDPLRSSTELTRVEPAEVRPDDLQRFMPSGLSIWRRPVVPPFPLPPEPAPTERGLAPLVRR